MQPIFAAMEETAAHRDEKGRWIIEGDLESYFDTVHHRLAASAMRTAAVRDERFVDLLWRS